jgi:hypothetical protein
LTLAAQARARSPVEIRQAEAPTQILEQHLHPLRLLRVDTDEGVMRSNEQRQLVELLDG